ncbi:cold-shock protein [Pseudovibrio sp. SPO723]|uniref:cold-shock protein n=1 Tax=Nesiotobacter zosterae TaxID=392721 RepID=UPI0029C16776|nr:cold-shock protein [Pseudovibrio sp. SPO723]MDX5593938.1 cold-shock protein [Pseudovibrio sp. SPO723]
MHDGNSGRRPRNKRGGKREFGGAHSFGPEFGAPDFLGSEPGYSPYQAPRDDHNNDRNDSRGGYGARDRGSYGSRDRGPDRGGDRGGYRGNNDGDGQGRPPFGGGGNRGPRREHAPVERGPRQSGTVKFFKQDKGFGFITPDSAESDVFVHISAVERSGLQSLDSGMRISFETEPDRRGKGPKAVELKLLEGDAPATEDSYEMAAPEDDFARD